MQRKHVVLMISVVLIAAFVLIIAVDPALAQAPKGGKSPGEAGHAFADAVKQFFLPIAFVLTVIGAAFDAIRGNWGGFFTKLFLGSVVIGFLTMPDQAQRFMQKFVNAIVG